MGGLLLVAIISMSLRKYDGIMRMVSTNSMAISAACHALEEDRVDGYRLPVRWAVLEVVNGIGHCAFTTAPDEGHIRLPEKGRRYL